MSSSFLDEVLRFPERTTLMADCPALALLCHQCVFAARRGHSRLSDPIPGADDDVAALLSAESAASVGDMLFGASVSERPFWCALRAALVCQWDPRPPPADGVVPLCAVRGVARVDACRRVPLPRASLRHALRSSRRVLRAAAACALAGSAAALPDRRDGPLGAMLQFARLVPANAEGATAEGVAFAMRPLQQQWWALVAVAMDRAMALAFGSEAAGPAARAQLWQLLAVLAALDTTRFAYPFPEKPTDPLAFHLFARLAEVGLVYPLLCDGRRCFAVSPHFQHALFGATHAPLCAATLIEEEVDNSHDSDSHADARTHTNTRNHATNGSGDGNVLKTTRRRVRGEDEDTIITETNFRLYAYTRNSDLLRILDQFAHREAEVERMIVCYRVSRASFAAALRKGVTAANILQFLAVRAHPSMRRSDCAAEVGTHVGVIPQSFCDQLLAWEGECRRLMFERRVVLLRNISAAQRERITDYLTRNGERFAVVREENGHLVVRRDAYERILAPLLQAE